MSESSTILICDDELYLREMVGEYLTEKGFEVIEVGGASELRAAMKNHDVDLVILDISMPGEDGLSALRRIRETSNVLVIMLTAVAEVVDRIVGLELGADDYIAKPVNLRELEARVKSALRRGTMTVANEGQGAKGESQDMIEIGRCIFDQQSARLFEKNGDEISITAMEFELLKLFIRNQGQVLDRDDLIAIVHERGWHPFDRSIDLRISRLRRKIEFNAKKPQIIRTVRGVGYIFDTSS
ncbi:MAG: response regulator [Gammaproteobacteria bacterium]|nr:response regulator [Gammaproteobacteria bacterium]